MSLLTNIAAISSGMYAPKKGEHPFLRAHRYLNYGLLGLISRTGSRIPVVHGNFLPPDIFLTKFPFILSADTILLSLPSFFSVPWARQLVATILKSNPRAEIHLGGRWVIDHNWEFVREKFPGNVTIHKGLGEHAIDKLASKWRKSEDQHVAENTVINSQLNYTLLCEKETFHPSVEVSRGCGLGCAFCEEAKVRMTSPKSPASLLQEISNIMTDYGETKNIYFESSLFAPSTKWVDDFAKTYHKNRELFNWRTETRVDVLTPDKLSILADAGLKVIDLGLESGSPRQLINMGKTADPEAYLSKAKILLESCKSNGVWAKVNILLYPGESKVTIDETRNFLTENMESIYGVSTYPVIAYGMGERLRYFDEMYRNQGALGLVPTDVEGVWEVELSSDVSAWEGKELARELAREFMTMRRYFDLKTFSYLDPKYTWDMFVEDVDKLPRKERSFST